MSPFNGTKHIWGWEELLRVKIKEQHFGVMLRIGASRRAFTVDY